MAKFLKNQTKAFVVLQSSVEGCHLVGVDMSLDDALRRIRTSTISPNYYWRVVECPIGSPFNLEYLSIGGKSRGYVEHKLEDF